MINFKNKKWLWTGRVLRAVVILFMLFDGVIHLSKIPAVTDAFAQMGYSLGVITPLSIIELLCVILYIIPSTSILGAILLTGYLGGAVDSNVHAGSPLFSAILFPVYVAILLWGGLYLRDSRLRELIPCSKKTN
jgi:DoxX-like family